VSFVFRSVFHDLIARDWDDEQGVPTPVFNRFAADVLPRLNAVLRIQNLLTVAFGLFGARFGW
jgi:hypothetical protein